MKNLLISFVMLVISCFLFSCENGNQLTQTGSDEEYNIINKKPVQGELISFIGDLEGSQEVIGCCPNAGPFPEYILKLKEDPFPLEISGRELDGNIFMNKFGRNLPWEYKVQFSWCEINSTDTTFIEVRGGVLQEDKKNKITTVTFIQDTCWIWYSGGQETIVFVDFTLERKPL